MTDSIPIPDRLARRPRDARGYPVPANVVIDATGKPDFRVTDINKWLAAVQHRTCALCAEPLGRHLAFVGGPLSHANRLFTDLPMHRDCAQYALQVCPFLAAPNFRYAPQPNAPEGFKLQTSELVSVERPDRHFLGITRGYDKVRSPQGHLLVHAAPWDSVQWWRHGKLLSG